MLFRLLAGLLGPLFGIIFGCPVPTTPTPPPASPSPSAPAGPGATAWPYPKACLETEIRRFEASRDPDEKTVEIHALLGASRPCANATVATRGVRLALTQYQLIDGKIVGRMGSPWQTNSIGDMKFRRPGTIPGDLVALCLSTGLKDVAGGVVAEHNRCFRPKWADDDPTVADGTEDVPTDDPSVSAPLQRFPAAGDTAPAGCWNCLITSPTAPLPTPEPMPYAATVEPDCVRLSIDETTIDDRRSIELIGTVRSCVPDHTNELYLAAVFYGAHGGRLGRMWTIDEPDVHEFFRSTSMRADENAICVTTGRKQTDDGSYAHHEVCLAIEKNAQGRLEFVRIPLNDARVMMPVDTLDDGDPGGSCVTCL
jgi:hypothetical protein